MLPAGKLRSAQLARRCSGERGLASHLHRHPTAHHGPGLARPHRPPRRTAASPRAPRAVSSSSTASRPRSSWIASQADSDQARRRRPAQQERAVARYEGEPAVGIRRVVGFIRVDSCPRARRAVDRACRPSRTSSLSNRASTTTTVTLSLPPAATAAPTSLEARSRSRRRLRLQAWSRGRRPTRAISLSASSFGRARPSTSRKRSRPRAGMIQTSASTCSSAPSARVTTLRSGCRSASCLVIIAEVDELLHRRMVHRELLERAADVPVRPRVADVERHPPARARVDGRPVRCQSASCPTEPSPAIESTASFAARIVSSTRCGSSGPSSCVIDSKAPTTAALASSPWL